MGRTACTEPQCLYKGDLYLYLTGQKKRTASEEMMLSRKNFSRLIRGNKSDYVLPKTEVLNLSLYKEVFYLLVPKIKVTMCSQRQKC